VVLSAENAGNREAYFFVICNRNIKGRTLVASAFKPDEVGLHSEFSNQAEYRLSALGASVSNLSLFWCKYHFFSLGQREVRPEKLFLFCATVEDYISEGQPPKIYIYIIYVCYICPRHNVSNLHSAAFLFFQSMVE
jgi:hypothetical protein